MAYIWAKREIMVLGFLLHMEVLPLYLWEKKQTKSLTDGYWILFSTNIDSAVLARNVKILAEGLARHIFNLSSIGRLEIFNEGLVCIDFIIFFKKGT